MREIKFRVWNTETNKMIVNVKEMGVFALQSIYSIDEFLVIPTNEKYPLMQYTGLKDKNGVEIYEGDIVNIRGGTFYQGYWEIDEIFEVVYDKYGFLLKNKDYKESFCIAEEIKVIGNIYENPELLGE